MNPVTEAGDFWECGGCHKRWDYKIQALECCADIELMKCKICNSRSLKYDAELEGYICLDCGSFSQGILLRGRAKCKKPQNK